MMERKIGAQLFTIREFTKTPDGVEESLQKIADIGYTFAQMSAFGPIEADRLKAIIDKTGVQITGSHNGYDKFVNHLDELIAEHKTIGCMMPGIGALPPEAQTSVEGVRGFVKEFNAIADKLAAEGMTFTYHNHAFEFIKLDGKYMMDYILEESNDNFKLMLDVYWLSIAAQNPAKFIRKYKDKIGGIHFKDLRIEGNTPKMAEVMEGNLDWEDIIAACEEANPRYIYVEQDDCGGRNPFEALKTSYENLKAKGFR